MREVKRDPAVGAIRGEIKDKWEQLSSAVDRQKRTVTHIGTLRGIKEASDQCEM